MCVALLVNWCASYTLVGPGPAFPPTTQVNHVEPMLKLAVIGWLAGDGPATIVARRDLMSWQIPRSVAWKCENILTANQNRLAQCHVTEHIRIPASPRGHHDLSRISCLVLFRSAQHCERVGIIKTGPFPYSTFFPYGWAQKITAAK